MEILHHKHQNTHKNLFLKKGGRGQHSITPTQTLVQHTLSMGPFLPVLLNQPSWACPFRKSLVLCPCWVTLESLSLSGCSLSIFHSVLLFPTHSPSGLSLRFQPETHMFLLRSGAKTLEPVNASCIALASPKHRGWLDLNSRRAITMTTVK